MNQLRNPHRQAGFSIIVVLLAAVVLLALVSAMMAQSRSGALVSGDSVKPTALAVIAQGDNIAAAFKSALLRETDITTLTLDNGATGLYNPSISGLALQTPPNEAFDSAYSGTKNWLYFKNNFWVQGVGSESIKDYTVSLVGLSDKVCGEINKRLGYSPSGGFNNWNVFTSTGLLKTNVLAGSDIDLSSKTGSAQVTANGTPAFDGLLRACVYGSGGDKIYYVVVEPK